MTQHLKNAIESLNKAKEFVSGGEYTKLLKAISLLKESQKLANEAHDLLSELRGIEPVESYSPLSITINGKQDSSISCAKGSSLTLSWILRCFLGMIHEVYEKGAPRSIEADEVVKDILLQVQPQLSVEDFKELSSELHAHMEK